MTVLVLNHRPLDQRPIGTWLKEAGDLVMVTTRAARVASSAAESAKFSHIVAVDDYTSSEVERAARVLMALYSPARVVSSCEFDLIRAAVLRERHGLAGQSVASALAHRDKLRMREVAAADGVQVPRFREVRTVTDAVDFAADIGFPIVVKPRHGTGTAGIKVVACHADLVRSVGSPWQGGWQPDGLLVEEYVDAPLYHVDGLCISGRTIHCWPSRYSLGAYETVRLGAPRLSVLLDAGDRCRVALQDFAAQVLTAFPTDGAAFAFHLEAWVDSQGMPIMCEITSRTGGGPIGDIYEHAFGVNLYEESFRAQAGLSVNLRRQPSRPLRYIGWVWFPVGKGTFVPPPEASRPPAIRFVTLIQAGQRCDGAQIITDAAAFAIVDGDSAGQVKARGQALANWWTSSRPWL